MFFVQINHTGKGFLFLIFREIKLRKYSSLHKLFYGLVIQNNDVQISFFQNKTIIQVIIHPEPFNTRPITAFGKAYIRTGDGDQVATKEQLKYFTVESQSEINTHLLPSTYTIEDLDAESIKEYRKIIEEKGSKEAKTLIFVGERYFVLSR